MYCLEIIYVSSVTESNNLNSFILSIILSSLWIIEFYSEIIVVLVMVKLSTLGFSVVIQIYASCEFLTDETSRSGFLAVIDRYACVIDTYAYFC